MKAMMKGHKVLIEGKLYRMNDINSIPTNAHPRKSAEYEDDSGIFLSGRFPPFSNFHSATFEIEGRKFKTSEQYYQYRKAVFAQDVEAQIKILADDNPVSAKKKGDNLKDVAVEWMRGAKEAMLEGLTAKFGQNKKLAKELLNTGEKCLWNVTNFVIRNLAMCVKY